MWSCTRAPLTTDRNTRVLPTRGHARQRVHRADRRITNLCAHRSLGYSTRPGHTWAHQRTCAPYTAVPVLTSARAGRYTTNRLIYLSLSQTLAPQFRPSNTPRLMVRSRLAVGFVLQGWLEDKVHETTSDGFEYFPSFSVEPLILLEVIIFVVHPTCVFEMECYCHR